MQISIANAQFNTLIFGIIFVVAVLLSIRRPENKGFFAPERTQELKGFAILAIVFSHIGYFLSRDTDFLWPFSVLAGVGVNLFLFLSGFGITVSSLKSPLPVFKFYLKRLSRLMVPMWIIVGIFIALDFFILGRSYPSSLFLNSLFGFFPQADLFLDLNSPLWYFSLILFYYIIFPLCFYKKYPYFAPILILGISFLVLKQKLPVVEDVSNLYKTHFAAFPLGVLFAVMISDENIKHLKIWVKKIFLLSNLKYLLIILFAGAFGYFSINSGVGESKNIEQTISLITMFCIIFLFIAKSFDIKLFTVFGFYSYEIYLIHWPILSRYDYLYKYLPAWLATILYLLLFLGLGYVFQKIVNRLHR